MKRHWIYITSIILLVGCLAPGSSRGAVPAIQLNGASGAYTYNSAYGAFLAFEIIVIDQDGISEDGGSHQVEVVYPDGTSGRSDFYGLNSPISGNYWRYDSMEVPVVSGTYTFRVTDPEGNTATATDELNVNILDPLDEYSFTPTLKNPVEEFITATFDNVLVNGQSYDDFDNYATVEDIDPARWNVGSCKGQSGISIANGASVISQADILGSNSCWLSFPNPEDITSIQADITVTSASSGIPRGRIGAVFYNNGMADIWTQINVATDRVQYSIGYDNLVEYNGVEHNQWVTLAFGDIMEVAFGQTVSASISWDGSTLLFTANGNSVSYSPTGTIRPTEDDYKGLSTRISLNMPDTTPIFSWNPISGADRYRVRIYNTEGTWDNTVWRGYVNQTTYQIPPGVLLPDTDYRYRIDVRDNHIGLDVDNFSKAPASEDDKFLFFTGNESTAPYIDMDNVGVETWTDNRAGNYTDFWIKVHDGQGVPGNIKTVSVTFPDGGTTPLYYDQDNGENSSTAGIYRYNRFGSIQAGVFTFSVEDQDGNTVTLTEELNANPIGYPALETMQPENNTVIQGTAVEFDWGDVEGAAFYQLKIYDKDFSEVYSFSTTDSAYSLSAGFLKENTLYRYLVETRREFYDQNVNNGSGNPTLSRSLTFRTGAVAGGANAPTVDLADRGATVVQYPKPGAEESVYALEFFVSAGDPDGVPENVDTVRVIYPDGVTTRELTYYEAVDATQGYYWLEETYDSPDSIPPGVYTFIVTDFDGNSVQTTDDLQVYLTPIPTNLNPAPDTTVSTETPTIFWDSVTGASQYRVRIHDGWDGEVHVSDYLTANNYRVPADILQKGRTYSYRVEAFRETGEVDSYSKTGNYWSERTHFTVTESLAGNTPPASPVIMGPPDESIDADGAVTLTTGAFVDPDGDAHAQTQWLIRRADKPYHSEQNPDFNKITTGDGLTAYSLSNLDLGLKYTWKAGYMDAGSNETTWSEESNFKVGASSVQSGARILPGESAADFRMVSITQWPDDPSAESVLGDEMDGEYDTRLFRIGAYDPMKEGGTYREYSENLTIQPGRAYWIFARQGLDLTVDGVPVSTQHDIEVELHYNSGSTDGWNMIAPPNSRAYDWASVQILEYDSEGMILFGPTAVGDLAEDNPYIDTRLWRWEAGAYAADTLQMVPGEGYWVKTFKPNVYLRFPAGVVVKNNIPSPDYLAEILTTGADWMRRLLPSPRSAMATANDEPPPPISGFSDEPIVLSSESGSGGGSCFIETVGE